MSVLAINEQSSQDLCIKQCLECFEHLTRAVSYCLEKEGDFLNGDHLKLFFEGIDLCRVNATLLMSQSELALEHGQITAKICDMCAKSCFSYHDDFLSKVGNTCSETATLCRQLAH